MGFIKDFWLTGFTSIVITIIAFLNNVMVTRYLGPEGRGKYSIISYIILFIALILGEGVRRLNTITIGRDEKSFFALTKFNFKFLLLIIIFLLLLNIFGYDHLVHFLKLDKTLFGLTLLISLLFIIWQLFQAVFLGFSNIPKYNLLQVSTIGIFLLLNLSGIYFFKIGLYEIVINQLIASLTTMIFGLILIREYYGRNASSSDKSLAKNFPLIFKSTVSATLIYVILKSDIFIINYYLDFYNAGIYSIGIICSDLFQKIPTVIGTLVLSRTVSSTSADNSIKISKLVRVTIIFNLILIVILIVFGSEIIVLLFKNQFISSFKIILLLIPALFVFGPGAILYSYYMGKGFPNFILLVNAFAAVLSISLNIIMVPKFGISAAALICSGTYLLWSSTLILHFKFETRIPFKEILIFQKNDLAYILNSFKR